MRFIRINTVTKEDRHESIDRAKDALSRSGAWITNYRMYSNRMLCIQFEIGSWDVSKLAEQVPATGLAIVEESLDELKELTRSKESMAEKPESDIMGTLQITFVHDGPDMLIEVPPLEL